MSALPPKADKQQTCRYVRFVPIATERDAAKNRYSFTPSARASSVGGTSRLARKDSRNEIYEGALDRLASSPCATRRRCVGKDFGDCAEGF